MLNGNDMDHSETINLVVILMICFELLQSISWWIQSILWSWVRHHSALVASYCSHVTGIKTAVKKPWEDVAWHWQSQSTQFSRKTRPVMCELQYWKWKWAKANLAPMCQRLGPRVFSTSHAMQAAALSHFSGALNAAAWQEPSPSAMGRRGPCSGSLWHPLPQSWQLAVQAACAASRSQKKVRPAAWLPLHLCPWQSSTATLKVSPCFPRMPEGFRVKKRDYRYKLHPCIIASKRNLWQLCLIFLPESLCDTCLEGHWCKFNGITQLQVLLSIQMNYFSSPPYLDQVFLFLMSTNVESMSHIPTSVVFWDPDPRKMA